MTIPTRCPCGTIRILCNEDEYDGRMVDVCPKCKSTFDKDMTFECCRILMTPPKVSIISSLKGK